MATLKPVTYPKGSDFSEANNHRCSYYFANGQLSPTIEGMTTWTTSRSWIAPVPTEAQLQQFLQLVRCSVPHWAGFNTCLRGS